MKYTHIPAAHTVVAHCKAQGIQQIVISPGSRNAPLTLAFTADPYFNCYSIVDERAAAFFALGLAQQSGVPVAVVCTSGSALLNYYPAIAEAFYSDIPLVAITADRPPHKIDIGDGQTIRQVGVFQNHIGYSASLRLDSKSEKDQREIQAHNDREVANALALTQREQAPVHINVPMEEPLYTLVDAPPVQPNLTMPIVENQPELPDMESFAQRWNAAQRKLILVGVLQPNSLEEVLLDQLVNDDSVLLFTETTSNLHHSRSFPSIDSIIAPIEKSADRENRFKALQPDILLTFGGMVVSKKVKAFLRNYQPHEHWHVDSKKAYDTYFSLTQHFKISIADFCRTMLSKLTPVASSYYPIWATVREGYQTKRKAYIAEIPFSDLSVFHSLSQAIPPGVQLQLANSSTVRYAQLFPWGNTINCYCNRGTSGIDGSTATAVGASLNSEHPTVLITGDLSFFYDANGLWNSYVRPNFKIVLVNNGGGGIFRILPGHEETDSYARFFETTHNLEAVHLCRMHGIQYTQVTDGERLLEMLPQFFESSDGPALLEIQTPRKVNDKILQGYFDFIS